MMRDQDKGKRFGFVLHSQKKYRSDLNWMKGAGWEASGCLDVQQAKKAGDIVSEVGLTFDPLNEKTLTSLGHLGDHTPLLKP